jgi:hypothetical protein
MTDHDRCPHCGANLNPDPRTVYTFSKWATPVIVGLISLLLLAIDFVNDGPFNGEFISRFEWSQWATLGIWIFYMSVQLFRSHTAYRWLMIPFSGTLFSIFFIFLDLTQPPNDGFFALDWALYVVFPFIVFLVLLPIIARIAREAPTYQDQLEYLVDQLTEEQNNAN